MFDNASTISEARAILFRAMKGKSAEEREMLLEDFSAALPAINKREFSSGCLTE